MACTQTLPADQTTDDATNTSDTTNKKRKITEISLETKSPNPLNRWRITEEEAKKMAFLITCDILSRGGLNDVWHGMGVYYEKTTDGAIVSFLTQSVRLGSNNECIIRGVAMILRSIVPGFNAMWKRIDKDILKEELYPRWHEIIFEHIEERARLLKAVPPVIK